MNPTDLLQQAFGRSYRTSTCGWTGFIGALAGFIASEAPAGMLSPTVIFYLHTVSAAAGMIVAYGLVQARDESAQSTAQTALTTVASSTTACLGDGNLGTLAVAAAQEVSEIKT